MLYKITNIKVSLKIDSICLSSVYEAFVSQKIVCKKYANFLVVNSKYTYIIFKTGPSLNNHINITKIKEISDVDHAINHLKTFFVFNEQKRTIDNITASCDKLKELQLDQIIKRFSNVSYNTEKFPGAFVKFDYGTVILFHTGKCILIGAKSRNDLECLITQIADI